MKQWEKLAAYGRKFFSDKTGHVVLWQRPNLPLIVWAVARIAAWPLSGRLEYCAGLIATGALLLWALLELFRGVTYFRRTLGLVVLAMLVVSATH